MIFFIILDKYDKIGVAGVVAELRTAGFSAASIQAFEALEPLLRPDATFKLLEQPDSGVSLCGNDTSLQVYEDFKAIRHLISKPSAFE